MKMSNRGMRGTSLVLIAAAAFQVTACASAPSAKPETIGNGSYAIVRRAGLPARNGLPAVPEVVWSETDWADFQDLDRECHKQMDPLIPGMASQVVWPSLKLALSTGLFGGLIGGWSAVASFTGVSFGDYAGYMGGAGFGSSFGSGLATYADRAKLAQHYVDYACMQFQITQVNKYGRVKGYGVIPWAGAGNMKPITKPTGMPLRQPEEQSPSSDPKKDDANPDEAPVAPPM